MQGFMPSGERTVAFVAVPWRKHKSSPVLRMSPPRLYLTQNLVSASFRPHQVAVNYQLSKT